MSKIEFLRDQVVESRNFVNRLISEIPQGEWYVIPEHTDSNFAWQIGHLMLSENFHILTSLTGKHPKVYELIPVAGYVKIFNGMGALHRSVEEGLVPAHKLKEQFDTVHQICIEQLGKLTDSILTEPIPFKHPIAVTKYEALSWSFKHEMWHSAEMEDIKRALGYPIKWI
jgi:hypothetical protein